MLTLDGSEHHAADKGVAVINTHPVYHQKLRARGPAQTNTRAFQTRSMPLTVR